MSVITIPKQLMREKELVLIPKKEYEELLDIKKRIKTVKPTKEESRIIAMGRREIELGRYESWDKVKNELERSNHKKR